MAAKFSPYMYSALYIFYFVHPFVKTVEMMVQRVDFERNLKNICPATVLITENFKADITNLRGFFVGLQIEAKQ